MLDHMTTNLWCSTATAKPWPPALLERARLFVLKTAGLSGLLAPETALRLGGLLRVINADYLQVLDGHHDKQEYIEGEVQLESRQCIPKDGAELGHHILDILARHYVILHERPHREIQGVVARMITHQQFAQLGLQPNLWSLTRGLARRYETYQSVIAKDDQTGRHALADRPKLTFDGTLRFVEFVLDVCHEEVDYIASAFNRRKLRESILKTFRTNQRLLGAGVKAETAPAVLALLIAGSLPTTEFMTFTGFPLEAAADELRRLRRLGIVQNSTTMADRVEPGLPKWLGEEILPCL